MTIWEQILEILIKIKELILGLSADQITLISIGVTLLIFVAGQRSETKFKRLEVRRTEYKKFIAMLQETYSGKLQLDEKTKKAFFDVGVSLLLYGSKRVYKKYIFFREYSVNPIIQKSKYNNDKVLLYVVADILKSIRHEVGLTNLSDLESNEVLSFFVNDLGTNPLSRIDSYKAQYSIFMIKCELFFFNRIKWITTKKVYFRFVKPVFGVLGILLRYLLLPLGFLVSLADKVKKCLTMQSAEDNCGDGETVNESKKGFVIRIFECEWKLQQCVVSKLWADNRKVGEVDYICLIILLADLGMMLFTRIPQIISFSIFVMISTIITARIVLRDAKKAMTTLSGFMGVGMCLLGTACAVVIVIFAMAFKEIIVGVVGQYVLCFVVSIVLAFIWGAYSTFCHTGVATFANALLTGIVGLIVLTKDLLVKTLFIEKSVSIFSADFEIGLTMLGIGVPEFIDSAVSLAFYPLLLMFGWATMTCAAKKYWIDKYNEGKDIDKLVIETTKEILNVQ